MKLRMGFVSNSSTTSFVICGFEISMDDEQIVRKLLNINSQEDMIKKMKKSEYYKNCEITQDLIDCFCQEWVAIGGDEDCEFHIQTREGFEEVIIGVEIANTGGDSYIEDKELDLEEIYQKTNKLKDILGISGSPKIYAGTTSC